jgi:hypothetical protein
MSTGKIIVIAFPDTFVTMSSELICKFLPWVGLGTRNYIKAGHAALVLINNKSGEAKYFDFGRYVTPHGNGRVRGANTDAELGIPFKAEISIKNELINLDHFLIWLDANPQKTHGEGRLLASVCEDIEYEKAACFINNLQKKGSIPYGAFDALGSNCSRFVTDTILSSTSNKKIIAALNINKLFTPSTVGNVEKASTSAKIYQVYNGSVTSFMGSALKENLKNYFDKKRISSIIEYQNQIPDNAQKLSGIGSNAWFTINNEMLPSGYFRIRRYNDHFEIDFDGVYKTSTNFNLSEAYQFTYDSHCEYCHILQNNKKVKFEIVNTYAQFNLEQKVHLV